MGAKVRKQPPKVCLDLDGFWRIYYHDESSRNTKADIVGNYDPQRLIKWWPCRWVQFITQELAEDYLASHKEQFR